MGVKGTNSFLRDTMLVILSSPNVNLSIQEGENYTGKTIDECINSCFLQDVSNQINSENKDTSRKQNVETLYGSSDQQNSGLWPCRIKTEYDAGSDESTVKNYDERYFRIGMGDGKGLDFQDIRWSINHMSRVLTTIHTLSKDFCTENERKRRNPTDH